LDSLVRHAPFILPENRNLVPTLFTRVVAHVTFKQLLRRKGDGDPLGRPVKQKRHGQQISLKAQTSITRREDGPQAALAAYSIRAAKNIPPCRKVKMKCAAGSEWNGKQ